MRGYVESGSECEDTPLEDMPVYSAGVLTRVPCCAAEEVGDPVIRLDTEFEFLGGSGTCAGAEDKDNGGYYYRPLRKNELLLITNED